MELREEIFAKLVVIAARLFGKKPEELLEELSFVQDLQAKFVYHS
ncbi:hypothetical protein [Paenibacillus polymyxa]|nr:hypothetical protein [Paenibacillus polymyxa]MDY8025530.1 hypothetical protein [Paenibacillus polymyxa]